MTGIESGMRQNGTKGRGRSSSGKYGTTAVPYAGQVPRLSDVRLSFGYNKGQQGNRPRPLDCNGQFPLVFGAVSRNAPRHDLTSLSCKFPQCLWIFVFDLYIRIGAESTEFPSMKELFLRSRTFARTSGCRCRVHATSPPSHRFLPALTVRYPSHLLRPFLLR
jgi:hypothetical protein